MRLLVVAILLVVVLMFLDRLLLAAERRGWIYYRKKKASPGTRASAALEMQALLEPDRRHVVDSVRNEESERDESGEPPEPGT